MANKTNTLFELVETWEFYRKDDHLFRVECLRYEAAEGVILQTESCFARIYEMNSLKGHVWQLIETRFCTASHPQEVRKLAFAELQKYQSDLPPLK